MVHADSLDGLLVGLQAIHASLHSLLNITLQITINYRSGCETALIGDATV